MALITTVAVTTEAATASSPTRARPGGRLDHGAAAASTDRLYRDHGRLVGGLCRALLRDRAEAEDAAQQVFLAAHNSLLNGTSPREPAAWLATIARNECWGRIRARMREPLASDTLEHEAATGADPVAEAIRNADLAALWTAIEGLPRQQRDALLLREFGGLSYDELSGALGVSGPAVESLLFRARHGIRAKLQTAYAGLTGGAWLESLARLAGAGGGLTPVAVKVATIGVGAAVVTGGAVVAPRVLDSPAARRVPAHVARSQASSQLAPNLAAVPSRVPPPVDVARRTPAAHVPGPTAATGGDEARGSDGHDRSGGDRTEGSDRSESSRREGASPSSDRSGGGDASRSGSSRDGSGRDGSGSDGSGRRGEGPDDGSQAAPPPAPASGSPAADGGLQLPTANPVVTLPTTSEPPLLDGSSGSGHGSDG